MRVEIKTKGKVTDPDIRTLYMIVHALDNSSPKMRIANLQFVAERMGFKLVKTQHKVQENYERQKQGRRKRREYCPRKELETVNNIFRKSQ